MGEVVGGTDRGGHHPHRLVGQLLHQHVVGLAGREGVVQPDVGVPVGGLLHPAAHLLDEVEVELCPEALVVEADLPGQAHVVDLLEVAEHLVPVGPDRHGVAAERVDGDVLGEAAGARRPGGSCSPGGCSGR